MRRLGPEEWSGLATVVVVGLVIGSTLIGGTVPQVWWFGLVVVLVAAVLRAVSGRGPRWVPRTAYAVGVVAAWVLLATASSPGLLPVVLVVVAAVSVEVIPTWAGLAVVALNTVVIAAVAARTDQDGVGIVVGAGFYLLIQLAAMFSTLAVARERRMRRELTEAHVELAAASVLLSESVRTAERLRISRDLHDLIGHQLTVLALELEAARHRDGARAREHVERANGVARELLGDVRATVGRLRTESPDLTATLRAIVRDLPGLDVSIDVAPEVATGEHQTEALVLAVRELVTNTLRHADARELWIDVGQDGDAVSLTAADDGHGAAEPVLGNGLRGLTERFEALGGEVRVHGGRGFRVTGRVPAS